MKFMLGELTGGVYKRDKGCLSRQKAVATVSFEHIVIVT